MKPTKGDCVRLHLVRVYKVINYQKNHPHLTEFKDFIDSFQFGFYVVYFELIYIVYVAWNYRPVRIFPYVRIQ